MGAGEPGVSGILSSGMVNLHRKAPQKAVGDSFLFRFR
jgi:hypothetical protein